MTGSITVWALSMAVVLAVIVPYWLQFQRRLQKDRERQKEAGLKEVKVWVPSDLTSKLRAYAKKLCASVTK